MGQLDENIKKIFLPPANSVKVSNPSAKPLSETERLSRARSLGNYGNSLITVIQRDYDRQIDAWNRGFEGVMAQFKYAVGKRNSVLGEAKLERERDAAIGAFILELFTVGAMGFVGAFVEHAVIRPMIKMKRVETNIVGGRVGFSSFFPVTKVEPFQRFTDLQASAFGTFTENIGTAVLNKAGTPNGFKNPPPVKYPLPQKKQYQIDKEGGIDILLNDLKTHVSNSSKELTSVLDDVGAWMNHPSLTDFGAAWLAYTEGDEEKARKKIHDHFEKTRKDWADKWEFFGKVPNPMTTMLLADAFERGLWAGYCKWRLSDIGTNKVEKWSLDQFGGVKLLENAIYIRLKELNVIMAETAKGNIDQRSREASGSPMALTPVEDDGFDTKREIGSVIAWADIHMKNAPDEMRKYFPPARKRSLPSL